MEWVCDVYISSRSAKHTDERFILFLSLPEEEFYYFTESSGKSRPISNQIEKKLGEKISI